jgi:hypothetical protein
MYMLTRRNEIIFYPVLSCYRTCGTHRRQNLVKPKNRTPTRRILGDNTIFLSSCCHIKISYRRFHIFSFCSDVAFKGRRHEVTAKRERKKIRQNENLFLSLFCSFVLSSLQLRQNEVTTLQKSDTIVIIFVSFFTDLFSCLLKVCGPQTT